MLAVGNRRKHTDAQSAIHRAICCHCGLLNLLYFSLLVACEGFSNDKFYGLEYLNLMNLINNIGFRKQCLFFFFL